MISLDQIRNFYPPYLRDNPVHQKYLVKEYIQLMVLNFLSTTSYIRYIIFFGGTYLRLVKGIDRFSEDIDFDCKDFKRNDFFKMTDEIIRFLQQSGYQITVRDRDNPKLKSFRRNIFFPQFLFELGLSGHKEERFLLKIETQDQQFLYPQSNVHIRGCGFFFPFPVPSDEILCAMKISALISRRKGRDFYDVMFLLSQIAPDYSFLTEKLNIRDKASLQAELLKIASEVDLQDRVRDFSHLTFRQENARGILNFKEFVHSI